MTADDRLRLPEWDALDDMTRHAAASAVAKRLPADWKLARIEGFALGNNAHQVALFDHADTLFALIPGGEIELGWDRSPLGLDAARRAELRTAALDAFGTDQSLEEMIDEAMTPLRTVTLAPFLFEVTPRMAVDYLADDLYDYEGDDDDVYKVAIIAELATGGFRLPTSDEWEHACAAGARSLFRWGHEWPGGEPYGPNAFDLHTRPNAFGLHIVESPYHVECIAELGFRGGDGGIAVCGGAPEPFAWHTFASAYLSAFEHAEDCLPETYEEARVRRVFPLPE